MRLIVGLGNPGEKYKNMRHNTGFIVLDSLVYSGWKFEKKLNAHTVKKNDIMYAKPQTFMNNSGVSVAKLVNYYDISLEDLVVIHDDIDLLLGEVKKQKGRGSAGHKGVESIIKVLGSNDFWRVRVGVGRPENSNMALEDWVLSDFGSEERKKIEEIAQGLFPL